MTLIIHTDGGSRGNPGKAAIGYTIAIPNQDTIKYGESIGVTTNNVAEYTAILHALNRVLIEIPPTAYANTEIILKLDSELAQKQLTGQYKIKNPALKSIAHQILQQIKLFQSVNFIHVRREFNKEADAMVNQALDNLH